jgi:hypothetical protein
MAPLHYMFLRVGEVTLGAVTRDNSNVAMVLGYLHKLGDLIKAYTGGGNLQSYWTMELRRKLTVVLTIQVPIDDSVVRRSLVLIYELMDETIDYGYPQMTELSVLKKYVTQGGGRPVVDMNVGTTLETS